MLKVNIICIGKLKEKYWKDAFFEYSKRLGAFCKFSITEVDEYKLNENASASEINAALISEGRQILNKIEKKSRVVALCIEGEQLSSNNLSDYIQNSAVNGITDIKFIIGGSFGLSDEIKNRAHLKLSFSKMTFPHQLARVLLSEQIYRAFQISSNSKYHK